MNALLERDDGLAQNVIDRDQRVTQYDVDIDEQCVQLLALQQPEASGLRFITTAMKIVTDFERIGDDPPSVTTVTARHVMAGIGARMLRYRVLRHERRVSGHHKARASRPRVEHEWFRHDRDLTPAMR